MIELGVSSGPTVETRSYESLLVAAVEDQAAGLAVLRPLVLGAVESCAGAYSRAFASAEVGGQASVSGAVTPAVLSSIARQMIRRGESVHLIDVDGGGRLRLLEVGTWSIEGGPDPEGWRYQVTTSGPSMTSTRTIPAAGAVHCRLSVDPARPWAGRGPLSWGAETGRLAAGLERALGDEVGGPVGHLIAIPQDAGDEDDEVFAALKQDIRGLRGKVALVETTAAGFAEGRAGAPRKDWEASRLGANPPASLIALRQAVEVTIAGVCGIPPVLIQSVGDGTAQRESYRRWLHASVQPLARLVEQELSEKLETDVVLSFRSLHAADVAGRSRAWRSLVGAKAKMEDADARRLTGLQ